MRTDVSVGELPGRRRLLLGPDARRGSGAARWLLELDEHGAGLGVPDVLAGMLLRRHPEGTAGAQLDVAFLVAVDEPSTERAQRVHHAVGVRVRRRAVAG